MNVSPRDTSVQVLGRDSERVRVCPVTGEVLDDGCQEGASPGPSGNTAPFAYTVERVREADGPADAPLVDWVEFTLHPRRCAADVGNLLPDDPEDPDCLPQLVTLALDLLTPVADLVEDTWEIMPYGGLGWKASLQRGHIRVLFGGQEGSVHVVLSGQACRQAEAEGLVTGVSVEVQGWDPWRSWLEDLLDLGAKFTRVDVAFDDTRACLNLETVKAHALTGALVTRVREAVVMQRYVLGGKMCERIGGPLAWEKGAAVGAGETLYVGSSRSEAKVRIYDKRLERIVKGDDPSTVPAHWVRVELQCRQESAQGLASLYVAQGSVALAGALRKVLDFTEYGDGDGDGSGGGGGGIARRNRYKRPPAAWWMDFLGACAKMAFRMAPKPVTLDSKMEWIRRSVGPALAIACALPGYGRAWLDRVIAEGARRVSSKDVAMLLAVTKRGSPPAFA